MYINCALCCTLLTVVRGACAGLSHAPRGSRAQEKGADSSAGRRGGQLGGVWPGGGQDPAGAGRVGALLLPALRCALFQHGRLLGTHARQEPSEGVVLLSLNVYFIYYYLFIFNIFFMAQ